MLIRHSWDQRFVDKLKELEDKYGVQMFELEGIGPSKLDINEFAKKFFTKAVVADVSSDANANVDDDSVLSFEYEFNKSIQKLNSYYLIWKKMTENADIGIKRANKTLELCINGSLKIHDAHMLLKPYCYGFTVAPIVMHGLPYIRKIKIGPPKHFSSFINLIIQFTAYASNQLAGAVAFPDLFVYMDWYARQDFGEDYLDKETSKDLIKQDLQSLVYSWNYPFRGSQSSFTNVSIFDDFFVRDLFSNTIYPDMSRPNFESIKKLQNFYAEWMLDESKKQVFTFPVNTAVLYKDENNIIKDENFLNFISKVNSYNGLFNIYTGPLSSISSCCRLRSDTTKVKEYANSFGTSGTSIGSHRVVTLNLPHIAYEAEDNMEFLKKVEYNVKAAQDILDIHRSIIIDNIENGKLPLYTHQFMDLNRQFSTIGFMGINEACEILDMDIADKTGSDFGKKVLDKINELNEQRTKIDGHIRNMEQIPGESAAVMFAKKDKLLFTNHKYKIYSNQYIPLWKNVDIHERIRLQGLFDSQCSGGAIAHLNVTDSLDEVQMKQIIIHAAKQGCIYFAVNMNQARCNSCGKVFIGKFDKSPCHSATMTNFLRVVGFVTPIDNWLAERREEYKIRQFYKADQIKC